MGADGPKASCVTWGPQVLREFAMATMFWLSVRYKFDCMIASDTPFDSRGRFSASRYPIKTDDFEVLRDAAMTTIFGFLYMWCTLAPPGEIRLNRPCAASMRPYAKLR